MAAGTSNGLEAVILRKAIDQNAAAVAQLLEGLPRKDNAGSIVDVKI